jgi:hypothetical protein
MTNSRENEGRIVEMRTWRGNKTLDARMGSESVQIVHENPEKAPIAQLPRLLSDRRIRVDPLTGYVYTLSYRDPGQKDITHLITEENTVYQRGESPKKVSLQRPNRYHDIESAIRSMEHVFDKYERHDGSEVGKTKKAVEVMRRILPEFRGNTPSEERLAEISEMAIRELTAAGFTNAEKIIKQDLAEQIIRATQVDVLGRVNPLISRSVIASAWVKTTRELLFEKKVREKYSYLYALLSNEREMERFYLVQAVRGGIDNISARGEKNHEAGNAIRNFEHFSRQYLGFRINVNPYRGPAMYTHVSLFGPRFEGQIQILRAYAGNEETANILTIRPIQNVYLDTTRSAMSRWEEISERLSTAREDLVAALAIGEIDINKNNPAV